MAGVAPGNALDSPGPVQPPERHAAQPDPPLAKSNDLGAEVVLEKLHKFRPAR